MKNQIKKIGSLLVACSVFVSSFSVSVLAAEGEENAEQGTTSGREYLLREDFSNFQNGGNGADNDRVAQWRVEGGQKGWNGDLEATELSVEDHGAMTKALELKNTANIIRGGKGWTEDKFIQPGETFSVEADIYAENASNFSLGIVSDQDSYQAEDSSGTASLFSIKENGDEKLYVGWGQGKDDNIAAAIPNVVFKRNEVNHIKADYTLNSDVSNTAWNSANRDTLTVIVTNSAGTTSGTVRLNYRHPYGGNPKPITGVRGINFFKLDTTTTVYIDNIDVYTGKNVLIEDDFTNYQYVFNGSRTDNFYLEGGNNGNVSSYVGTENVIDSSDNTLLTRALKIGPTDAATDLGADDWRKQIRGGRSWNGTVGAGGSYTVEFDIYAPDNNTVFSLGAVPDYRGNAEDGVISYLFHIDTRAQDTVYYNSDQATNSNPKNIFSGVKFKRDEVNHVKIDYKFNEDISDFTTDTMTLTVTNNTFGTTSSTVHPGYRYNPDGTYGVKPVTAVKGISFLKWDLTTTMYLDNFMVYRTNVTVPTATVSNANESSVTVAFSGKVNAAGDVYVLDNGAKLTTEGVLSDDGLTYTLSGDFIVGKEYTLVIPATVYTASGVSVDAKKEKIVPKYSVTTVTKDQDSINPEADLNISINPAAEWVGKTVTVYAASYDEAKRLKGVVLQEVTLEVTTNTVKFDANTLEKGNSYKIFVWESETLKPICSHL